MRKLLPIVLLLYVLRNVFQQIVVFDNILCCWVSMWTMRCCWYYLVYLGLFWCVSFGCYFWVFINVIKYFRWTFFKQQVLPKYFRMIIIPTNYKHHDVTKVYRNIISTLNYVCFYNTLKLHFLQLQTKYWNGNGKLTVKTCKSCIEKVCSALFRCSKNVRNLQLLCGSLMFIAFYGIIYVTG